MSPRRTPSNAIFGNGLKGRVTACRNRLRVSRHGQKVLLNDEPVVFGRETTIAFLDEYPAVRESSISSRDASEFRDGEARQSVEQELA